MKKIFIAFSHTELSPIQINDAFENLGVTEFVYLSDVNPTLQKNMSNMSPRLTLEEIQIMAERIVFEAANVGADFFFCTGEPTLMTWANLYASDLLDISDGFGFPFYPMKCVQSTTERNTEEVLQPDGSSKKTQIFKHIAWRDLF